MIELRKHATGCRPFSVSGKATSGITRGRDNPGTGITRGRDNPGTVTSLSNPVKRRCDFCRPTSPAGTMGEMGEMRIRGAIRGTDSSTPVRMVVHHLDKPGDHTERNRYSGKLSAGEVRRDVPVHRGRLLIAWGRTATPLLSARDKFFPCQSVAKRALHLVDSLCESLAIFYYQVNFRNVRKFTISGN